MSVLCKRTHSTVREHILRLQQAVHGVHDVCVCVCVCVCVYVYVYVCVCVCVCVRVY